MKFPWSHSTLLEVLKKDSKLHDKCDQVCQDIINSKLELSEFVDELGPALTHEDPKNRMKATMLLSSVLKHLPPDLLNEHQLGYLVTFYCDRMKDHHCVIPAILEGILALAPMDHLPEGSTSKLLRSLFLNIPAQSQTKEDRANYLHIIKEFADNKQSELETMGSDFVYGVIGAIDGERDPCNLMFLFEYMPKFLQKYPLLHLTEEMFEIFACYFPIDFHPSQNDPDAITRDKLAIQLENCLCGTQAFAEHCIPLLLEKLESDLIVAKTDSLRLMIKCTQVFEISKLNPYLVDIWKALKLELFPGSGNKEVFDLALEATKHVVIAAQTDNCIEEQFLTSVFVTVMGSIADVSSKMFENSIKLTLVCASASANAALFVGNKLLPITLSQLQVDSISEQQKISLIDVLRRMIIICKEKEILKRMDQELVGAVQKQFIQILVQESDSSELKRIALSSVTSIPEVVVDENRFVVYTTIVHVLLSSDDERLNVEDCLYNFALHYSVEVVNVIVDKLVAKIYETVTSSTDRIFHALGRLLPLEAMNEKIIKFFLQLVFEEPMYEAVAILTLNTMRTALDNPAGEKTAVCLYKQHELMNKFEELVRKQNSSYSSDFLYAVSSVMREIMKHLSPDEQKAVVNRFLVSMDLSKTTDLYLTSGILGYMDESIAIKDHFENLVQDLTKLSLESDDENVRTMSQHLLCSLFNRMPDDEQHRNVLMKLLVLLRKELKNHNKKAVSILSWIGKGLLARGHPVAGEIVDDIAELLDHPSLGHFAALAFEILSAEFPQLHMPLIKNLFKQKLFVVVMKKFEEKAVQYAETHLKALVYVYKIAPHLVLKMNIEKVGPILLKCLTISNDNALTTTLGIIIRFLKERDSFFQDHLQTLVPQLLKLSVYKSSMKVRIIALECLLYITKYPPFLLLPLKQDVVLELQVALDDHKRLVRNAAVHARLQWFLIGSGETSSDE